MPRASHASFPAFGLLAASALIACNSTSERGPYAFEEPGYQFTASTGGSSPMGLGGGSTGIAGENLAGIIEGGFGGGGVGAMGGSSGQGGSSGSG
ncbi:MAG: hypothetical protein MUF64_09335, partial [Polyangiaceae bacterium]|nr:hypothetical protein [Polyangiaceae bacterium]